MNGLDQVIQYGIAAVALWMMYSITYNHLTNIQTTLVDIKTILRELVKLAKD